MATSNAYCTLADYKAYITPAGQVLELSTADDAVLEKLIVRASRRIDDLCNRTFYPRIETKSYDVPTDDVLWLGDDLLAAITLTNGDTNTIASSEYKLYPANEFPKYGMKLKQSSSTLWEEDSSGNTEQVISLLGYWGYHIDGTGAWTSAGTLGAAWASTSTLSATLTAGHVLEAGGGQIIKIDSEIFNTSATTSTTLTVVSRGDNGSTAATHLISSVVYVWNHMADINQLALELTNIMNKSRFGENVETVSTATPAGVTITPRSLPGWAREVVDRYKRRVW